MTENFLIFLADDDEDDQMIFEDALSTVTTKCRLVTASDGNKLLQQLRNTPQLPDIIFLDLNMPYKNGRETLAEIRSNEKYRSIPVVIYSTSTSDIDIEQTYRSGANLYFEKPYNVDHLIKTLGSIIQNDWKEYFPRPDRDNYFISNKRVFTTN